MDSFDDLLVQCAVSSAAFGVTFFPNRFYRPFDSIHHSIFEVVDNPAGVAQRIGQERLAAVSLVKQGVPQDTVCRQFGYTEVQLDKYVYLYDSLGPLGVQPDPRYTVIAAPRGLGKTSISNLVIPAQAILFQKSNYIVPISMSAEGAVEQGENLKVKLLESNLISSYYGDITTKQWAKDRWVANVLGDEVCVFPRGPGQKIRGMLFRDHRPGLIVVDDLEDPDNMDSEEQRKKKKSWFYGDVLGCIDRARRDWRILAVGTVLHQDSLLVNLLESPNWVNVRLELCDDNFKSNAPNYMSDQECRKLYEQYKVDGETDVFFREYRNLAVATGSDGAFSSSNFKHYHPEEVDFSLPEFETVVLVDIARTANATSSESAVVGLSYNLSSNAIYVRYVRSGRWHLDQLYDEMIDAVVELEARILGVEVTGLHEHITYPIANELSRRGLFQVDLIELHARGGAEEKGKVARVRSLVPFYRKGLVFHNAAVCGPLEQQLLSFPRPRRWDIMDALGHFPELLDSGERFMRPVDMVEDAPTDIEREYEKLIALDEPALTGFRLV